MYLLMLLATFMSAIYGYNLSVRPEFDRDIPHKKALAVIYKFLYQHDAARTLLASRLPAADWQQPGDILYGEDDFILNYKCGTGDAVAYPLRKKDREGNSLGDGALNIIQTGRSLYAGDIMVSKLLCPEKELYEAGNSSCTSTPDPSGSGGIVDSCCAKTKRYLISYSKLDARWRNRITGKVSSDFLWALALQEFKVNIGVITWENDHWNFQGRTDMEAAYYEDKQKYIEEQKAAGVPEGRIEYPSALTMRTNWVLPEIFQDYFKDINNAQDMCKDSGCVFRIDEI